MNLVLSYHTKNNNDTSTQPLYNNVRETNIRPYYIHQDYQKYYIHQLLKRIASPTQHIPSENDGNN